MMENTQELTAEQAADVNGGDTVPEFVGFMVGYYSRQVYDWFTAPPITYDWTQK